MDESIPAGMLTARDAADMVHLHDMAMFVVLYRRGTAEADAQAILEQTRELHRQLLELPEAEQREMLSRFLTPADGRASAP